MKKILYVGLFTFLGLLLAAVAHAVIEAPTLWFITGDLEQYSDSFVWQNWTLLHRYAGGLLWMLGAGGGFWAGLHYWKVLYGKQETSAK